ncbi:MAG: M20/M25/M40 family metallo-hydrolase [Gammaproteobacteria bacterium]|nr:M20/M25/M40 family metallo-hydrolase [Gammaproteobacteria bacterium]MDH5801406.1 M20/M25/M40 family metallo-hydrolase [Gammaproteobacteria bacterium]
MKLHQLIVGLLLSGATLWCLADVVHHEMNITLQPQQSRIEVEDVLTLPGAAGMLKVLEFELHSDLALQAHPQISRVETGIAGSIPDGEVPRTRYAISMRSGVNKIKLKYSGIIQHELHAAKESDRSFSQTAGLIDERGVFLAASTLWYPQIAGHLMSFEMRVNLPQGWTSVTQGEREGAATAQTTWVEKNPQDEIYLLGGKYTYYEQAAGRVQAQVYLQKPDASLAQKYLDVTGQYIRMYETLLGDYPYGKFALVENFWGSGYGMPSFTLLGGQVIRLPFILHSSYPHEILHNWWGNGVYVDYSSGNWAEGLTAYLADHLINEQRGKGRSYRRDTLQKYADFVVEGRDFPLTEFVSRHNASSSAIGYGKTMMFFHMLRMQLGDEKFTAALQSFYRQFRFKRASFGDLENVFSKSSGQALQDVFQQWTTRSGAPELKLGKTRVRKDADGYKTTVTIQQLQKQAAYRLQLPVVLYGKDKNAVLRKVFSIDAKQQSISVYSSFEPLRLSIDPDFDVFRRVHKAEIPAALSQGYGAADVLLVLPSRASKSLLAAYEKLARKWSEDQEGRWKVKLDSQLKRLPSKGAVWLLGWNNRFNSTIFKALNSQGVHFDKKGKTSSVRLNNTRYQSTRHSLVLSTKLSEDQPILWLGASSPEALPGLTRKLPHYSKYSYLAFEGEEPENVLKGQWPVLNSPMTAGMKQHSRVPQYNQAPRQALAQLPGAFSSVSMVKTITALAGEAMAGRELGSAELDQAADFIAQQFQNAGLQAGGDKGSYFQDWVEDVGVPKGRLRLRNVIGILPGKNPAMKQQTVVLGAHYDHLGKGWPDVHQGDEGKIHYGADDNASGIAVMLEVLNKAKTWQPERAIVFVAFSGEEAGRRGSLRYVNTRSAFPPEQIFAMLNLDTVGRLGSQALTVFGTGSAKEWKTMFRFVGMATGVNIRPVADDFGSSDQKSFLDKGIPAVQFFGSVHEDFHRPGDRVDKIDTAGLVKVAAVVKETMEYLAHRLDPLTVTLVSGKGQQPHGPQAAGKQGQGKPAGRKVSLGTIPDFSYAGVGVKISGVNSGSPAQSAGLSGGDVIVKINAAVVKNLRDFAAVLRQAKVGDRLRIQWLRNGKEQQGEAVLVAR